MHTDLTKKSMVVFTALVYSCIGMAQDLFVDSKPITFVRMQKAEPTQTVGGYPILDLGTDQLLNHLETFYASSSRGRIPMGFASLIAAKDNALLAIESISANLAQSATVVDWTDEPCKKTDVLWNKSTGGNFSNVNCATISYQTGFARDYPTVVLVTFTRYSNSARRLVYQVNINPELFGVERDAEPKWEANSWHKSRIQADPKKVEFVDHLSKWAEDVQNRMNDAFEKKPGAFSGIAPLASYF